MKILNQKQYWLALLISAVVTFILSDIYASNILLNEKILNFVCQTHNSSCVYVRDIVLIGVPYLFLMPGFYFTIQLIRNGGNVSKVFAWFFLIGQIILLPIFWMLLLGMSIGLGLAHNGGPSF